MAIHRSAEPVSTTEAGPRVQESIASTVRQTTSNPLDPGRGRAFEPSALAPAPLTPAEVVALGPAALRRRTQQQQCQAAYTSRDINFCTLWLGGVPVGPPVGAASPRSAARRCASLALGSGGEGQTAEALRAVRLVLDQTNLNPAEAAMNVRNALLELGALGSTPRPHLAVRSYRAGALGSNPWYSPAGATLHYREAHSDMPSSSSENGEEEMDRVQAPDTITNIEEGAVYCPDCEMKLNGPTQWEDHKIGKKHRKNTQKKAGTGPTPAETEIKSSKNSKQQLPAKQEMLAGSNQVLEHSGTSENFAIDEAPAAPVKLRKVMEGQTGDADAAGGVGNANGFESGSEAGGEQMGIEPKQGYDGWGSEPGERTGGAGGSQQFQQWAAYVCYPPGYGAGPEWAYPGVGGYMQL